MALALAIAPTPKAAACFRESRSRRQKRRQSGRAAKIDIGIGSAVAGRRVSVNIALQRKRDGWRGKTLPIKANMMLRRKKLVRWPGCRRIFLPVQALDDTKRGCQRTHAASLTRL